MWKADIMYCIVLHYAIIYTVYNRTIKWDYVLYVYSWQFSII